MVDENKQNDHEQVSLDNDYKEETAAEVVPLQYRDKGYEEHQDTRDRRERVDDNEEDVGKGIGFFALALSVISLIFLPIIFGGAGIIFGFIARRRGVTTLGNFAIGIGAVAILLTMFVSPFT